MTTTVARKERNQLASDACPSHHHHILFPCTFSLAYELVLYQNIVACLILEKTRLISLVTCSTSAGNLQKNSIFFFLIVMTCTPDNSEFIFFNFDYLFLSLNVVNQFKLSLSIAFKIIVTK